VTVSSIVLSDPDRGITSQLLPRAGVAFQGLSAAASVRAVSESRQGRHGTRDTTRSFDDAAVSLTLRFFAATRALLDEVGAFCHPAARFYLIIGDTEWDQPRQFYLRYDSGNSPIELNKGLNRDVQYQWRGPHGVWEAATPVTAAVPAIVEDDNGGLTWTNTGLIWTNQGLIWSAGSSPSASLIQSEGNVEADWTAQLFGPCTGPKFANDTTGLTLEFDDDLVLNPGDYVLLDSSDSSALLNGDPSQSVLGNLQFATSDWWLMQPGQNQVRFYPTSASSSSAQAQITFSPAWACS